MSDEEALASLKRNIVKFKPDALVLGLGPSFHLSRSLDLTGYRTFGVNDVDRWTRVMDLLIIDRPNSRLLEGQPGFEAILNTTAERVWIRAHAYVSWKPYFSHELQKRVRLFDKHLHRPEKLFDKFSGELCYTNSSPTAAVTLAWSQGCRRIGIVGVDSTGKHPSSRDRVIKKVDSFLSWMAYEAREKGGDIVNLSPISRIEIRPRPCPFEKRARRTV